MPTATLEASTETSHPGQYLYLEDVTWSFYELMVEAAAVRHLQITFDQGRMEIMSPSPRHERVKHMLGAMIGIIALEKDIEMRSLGSTTFRRQLLGKGLEPDECFYIQNESKLSADDQIDLEVDPPPDLAIEVEVTSRLVERLPIYAALGIPEIWRHDGLRLTGLKLVAGQYEPIEHSLAFPFLKLQDINRFLDRWPTIRETALMREFRDWVRREL